MGPASAGPIGRKGAGFITQPRFRRGVYLLVAACAIILAIFAYRSSRFDFRWGVFAATFARMDPKWLAGSLFFITLSYLGRAIRWQVMLRPLRPDSSLRNLLSATVIGFTAIVIFGRAGELVRPYLISVKERVSFSSQLAAWLLERIYDLLVVLAIFGFSLSRLPPSAADRVGPALQWVLRAGGEVVGILCGLCLILLIVFSQFSNWMERRLIESLGFLPSRHADKIRGFVQAFVEGTRSTQSHWAVLLLVTYTFLEWLVIVGCFYCLCQSFPATSGLGLLECLILVGFLAFGSVVQIPGIGGGMQVATVLVLTELFGVPLEVATSIAIMIWAVTFVFVAPFGLYLGIREGLSWAKIKEIRKQAAV